MQFSTCCCSSFCGRAADIPQVSVVIVVVVGCFCLCKYTSYCLCSFNLFLFVFVTLRVVVSLLSFISKLCVISLLVFMALLVVISVLEPNIKVLNKNFKTLRNRLALCHPHCSETIFKNYRYGKFELNSLFN